MTQNLGVHLPFCFSGNRQHLTVGHVSMSKALLFKLHLLIITPKFCWFEIHRRNFRSIKDLFLPFKKKKVISVVSCCDTGRKTKKEISLRDWWERGDNGKKSKSVNNLYKISSNQIPWIHPTCSCMQIFIK